MGQNGSRRTKKRDKRINLVFDSTPLIYLAKVRILDKVSKLKGEKYIPQSVYNEIAEGKKRGKEDAFLIDDLINKSIFTIAQAKDRRFLDHLLEIASMDYADAETLALAKETKGVAIVDDSHARTIAAIEGIEFRGSIFILFSLCRNNAISKNQVKEYLNRMISFGWRCSTELYSAILDEIRKL